VSQYEFNTLMTFVIERMAKSTMPKARQVKNTTATYNDETRAAY